MYSNQLIVIKNEYETKKSFHAKAFLKTAINLHPDTGLIAILRKRLGIVDADFENESGVWVKLGYAFVHEWTEFEDWICAVIASRCDWNFEDVDILRPDAKDDDGQGPNRLFSHVMPEDPAVITEQWVKADQSDD